MLLIQGQVHRRLGSLRQENSIQTNCMQTYFLDSEKQANQCVQRLGLENESDKTKTRTIFMMCRRALEEAENSYLQSFLTDDRLIQSGNVKDVLIAFHADHRPAGEHQGRFKLPSVSEVAILMPNNVIRGF